MFEKNQILLGIIIGICVPIIGWALFQMLFEGLTTIGVMDEVTSGSSEGRIRTLALLGICSNIIPFEIYRKKRYDNTMRGLIFPTLIYVCIWVYVYRHLIMG